MSVLIDKINNYFKLSREISTLENSVSTKKQELERKYSIEYYKLKNELTNYLSNIRPTYEKVCSLYKTTPSMIENQMRLSVKSFMSKVTPINACEVAKKAGGESINFLSAAIKQINVSNFKEFAVRYYTVIEILSSIENLQSQAVSLELEFYQAKIDSLKSELQSICRDKNEFKCLARQAINAFQFRSDKIHMLRVLYEQDSQELLNDAMDLKEEILEEHKKVCQNMLSSEANMQFDGSYRFLVGFYQKEIEKEDLEFATTVLGIPEDIVKQEPIWFNYTSKHDTILIKAPSSFIESNHYNEFIRNLYFSFVSHLPARNMLFCGIECNTMESVVGGLEQKIRNQLGGSYIIHDMAERSNDITAHNGVLDALRGHANDNSRQQNGESIKDIFEYNEKFTDNPQKFAFFCVSNYPEGFNNATASAMQDMRRLLNGGSKGIISIICETTDGKYNDYAPILTPEELNADCIEFTSNGQMLYNGIPAVSKITTSEFNPDNYWFNLDKYFKSSASIYLEKLLDSADVEQNKPRPIAIPIGNSDGGLFHLELTECTVNLNGLIIGNIGSGKTAFLHTLILSAAYTYSPADLQFYLVDFKNKIGSTDFAPYRKQEGVKNLYIPHVRYLMLKGKAESAFELLDKIESMSEERAALLHSVGCSQIDIYNKRPEVLSGEKPKIPHVFFLIDEYNAMLKSGEESAYSNISTTIANKLKKLFTTARARGIGIILCGQSVDKAIKNSEIRGSMGVRISLPVQEDSELISLFDIDSYEAKKQMKKLAGQGDALVRQDKNAPARYVRLAYSGETSGAQQLRLAEKIRQKYKEFELDQVEAGSETAVPVIDENKYDSYYKTNKKELLLNMGISSANAFKIPLVYSYEDNSYNNFACASNDKLCKIERNAMFSFLHQTAKYQYEGLFRPITYLALKEKHQECLGEYFNQIPSLRKKIEVVETKAEIARTLMQLFQIYKERKFAVETNVSMDLTPMFVVLRDVLWLEDKDALWLANTQTTPSPVPTENIEIDGVIDDEKVNDLIKLGDEASYDDIYDAMNDIDIITADSHTANRDSYTLDKFSVENVRSALSTLFAFGNRYGIFLLVSTNTCKDLENVVMKEVKYKNLALNNYGIFGSFEEIKLSKEDTSAPADCAYITRFNSKVRLYDYDPVAYRSWWDDLQNKWKQ